MKSALFIFCCALAGASLALPQSDTSSKKVSSTKKKVIRKTANKAGSKAGTAAKAGARPPQPTWRNRQLAPTQQRYKEIQQALADKGYLKQEPTGLWDAQSVDALKQFQTDSKQQPTGKITSSALIGLGLGPKTADPSSVQLPAAPLPPPQL